MKLNGNKIEFEEQDLVTLNTLKEYDRLVEETKKNKQKCEILKQQAFSTIELFLLENNVEWNNLRFDDRDNYIEIKKGKRTPIDDLDIRKILGLD